MRTDPYLEYLARFQSLVGALSVGSYGSYQGKLIKKLAPDEFMNKHTEFTQLNTHYLKIVERGDTMNDALTKLIRERKAELLLPEE
ncbi:MAG TPA: hypothetical protein VMZ28_20450 [Kofleriaceae bacterium]|nr:hypothetical protein [Kofleriaceae bacterium]